MSACKCKWRKGGIVLDDKCDKIIRRWICDVDYYDPDVGCNRSCHGFSPAEKETEVSK